MDDEQLMELLSQIQELAGMGLEALAGAQGEGGPEAQATPPEPDPGACSPGPVRPIRPGRASPPLRRKQTS